MKTPPTTQSVSWLPLKKAALAVGLALTLATLPACTTTGFPAHGGGKRSLIEQELVSAAVRGALRSIDLSALRGRTVFLEIGMINDIGGGSYSGGNGWSLGSLLTLGRMVSPSTVTDNQYQSFASNSSTINVGTVTSTANTTSTENGTNTSTATGTNASSTTGSSTSNATTNSTSNSTGTNTSTSTGNSTDTSTTNSSGTTNIGGSTNSTTVTNPTITTTTQTGGVTTTQTTPGNTQTSTTNVGGSTNTNTGTATTNSSGSSSGTTNGSNTSATTGTATTNGQENSTSNTTGTSSSTQNGTSSTTGTATTGTASNSTGDTQTTGNAYLASPVRSIEQSSGNKRDLTATATYNGTPSYSSSTLYVSDSSYLTKMIIYYLRLNGVSVTFDPAQADSVLNVMVDVFGILTTKTDAVVYQNDKVRAKTTIEMAAFDRTGRQMIMPPTQGSYEALYEESKILSLGPYLKQKHSQKSDNLMEDFSMEQQN